MTAPASTTAGARRHRRADPRRWLALGLLGRRSHMTIGVTARARPRQTPSAVPPRPSDPPRTTARPGAGAGAASINARTAGGKSPGIASHVVALLLTCACRRAATPNPGWSPDQPRP
jgi:hypothetical protein